jgi:hypothetical protein
MGFSREAPTLYEEDIGTAFLKVIRTPVTWRRVPHSDGVLRIAIGTNGANTRASAAIGGKFRC